MDFYRLKGDFSTAPLPLKPGETPGGLKPFVQRPRVLLRLQLGHLHPCLNVVQIESTLDPMVGYGC